MPLSARIAQTIHAEFSKVADVANPAVVADVARRLELVNGTAATNQADRLFMDTRTLAASASENLDFAGALTDPFGDAFTPAEIVAIYIAADAGNTNNVVVGGAASNPWIGPMGGTGTYAVKPGEYALFVSQTGWPVTATTADLFKVLNSAGGTGVTYTIVVIGRSVVA